LGESDRAPRAERRDQLVVEGIAGRPPELVSPFVANQESHARSKQTSCVNLLGVWRVERPV
jgi:hypothetical protein